ncbi:TnsA endonuclease N terminal [Variovorax sp. YR266]|uniref:TnsA endonuclease N-terminal domain-containing protein n=1 Tax=Variovorax sp. YR266 TaxID=1884386 RepID=UPI00089875C5|nr:TnsA endonuclease N-terminal domain-containing protein [Variovorax sp. YR266]SDY32791.1 TnsA endonuclease N terminal [Variovorax sp. YR266]
MRTTKRFTPKVLARYMSQGRSTGTLEDFIPWHRVSRGDPSSEGRSHLLYWRDRFRELLSDGEWKGELFIILMPNVFDSREQFKLSLSAAPHELQSYDVAAPGGLFDGTLKIAAELGFRHPTVSGDGEVRDWEFTTDNLLTLISPSGVKYLLAVSFKYGRFDALKPRKQQLLAIEREYWRRRGVEWLLITPQEYDNTVANCLRCSSGWGFISEPLPALVLSKASAVAKAAAGASLTHILQEICARLQVNLETAQHAFWQSVWKGQLLLDLRRSWRPSAPVRLLNQADFDALNPLISRRSAWKI